MIYVAAWPDFAIKWRNLTWAEYKSIEPEYLEESSRFSSPMSCYLKVYNIVQIDSPIGDFLPAGIVKYVAEQQLKTNPFNGTYDDIKAQLNRARYKIDSSYLETAKCLVAAAFKYTFEEMENWDPVKFFEMVARAEKVLGRIAEPENPKAQPKEQPTHRQRPHRRPAPGVEVQEAKTFTRSR